MADEKVTLTAEELSQLFRKVDEVCQQAQKLRSELLARMNASRRRDRSTYSGQPGERGRSDDHNS
jgi:hypothetical protein